MKVWIVGERDYGDHGWSVVKVFDSFDKAEAFIKNTRAEFGYYAFEYNFEGELDEGWPVE